MSDYFFTENLCDKQIFIASQSLLDNFYLDVEFVK